MRQSAGGVSIYDANGMREVASPAWGGSMKVELEDLCGSIWDNRPVPHDGRWGMATLEACLAIMDSSRERREILLANQVPSPF